MATIVNLVNNTTQNLELETTIQPIPEDENRIEVAGSAGSYSVTTLFGHNWDDGIALASSRDFITAFVLAGVPIQIEEKLVGIGTGNLLTFRILAGNRQTEWATGTAEITFHDEHGNEYIIVATYQDHDSRWELSVVVAPIHSEKILQGIEHVVVLVNENRSMDNLLGWLYEQGPQPSQFLPAGSPTNFDGLVWGRYSNKDRRVQNGNAVYVTRGTSTRFIDAKEVSEFSVPSPDPHHSILDVNQQIFNGGDSPTMEGFLTNYASKLESRGQTPERASEIMQCYSPEQVPVINSLARSFATSDRWFSSVPSDTWPNRGFLVTGNSNGKVDNFILKSWHSKTIFDALESEQKSWTVFNNGPLPAQMKYIFRPNYLLNDENFKKIVDFEKACEQPDNADAQDKLPMFSYLEPQFEVIHDEAYKPPHDVRHAELFLSRVYEALRQCPYRDKILFVIVFDEHGGMFDHVPPPDGAAPPYPNPIATDLEFGFERYGVRVPAIAISSHIKPGTVFRSNTNRPLDHTSILATLRDWLGLDRSFARLLPSPRIAAAPTLGYILTENEPRTWPTFDEQTQEYLDKVVALPGPTGEEEHDDLVRAQLMTAIAILEAKGHAGEEALAVAKRKLDELALTAYTEFKTHLNANRWLEKLRDHLPIT